MKYIVKLVSRSLVITGILISLALIPIGIFSGNGIFAAAFMGGSLSALTWLCSKNSFKIESNISIILMLIYAGFGIWTWIEIVLK